MFGIATQCVGNFTNISADQYFRVYNSIQNNSHNKVQLQLHFQTSDDIVFLNSVQIALISRFVSDRRPVGHHVAAITVILRQIGAKGGSAE